MLEVQPMPEPAVKWIKALLSGAYTQGKGALGVLAEGGNNQFCCLGVAATVCFPEATRWTKDAAGTQFLYARGTDLSGNSDSNDQVLPISLWQELVGEYAYKELGADAYYQSHIADANDSGTTFHTLVEKYILPLYSIENIEQFEELYGPVSQQP